MTSDTATSDPIVELDRRPDGIAVVTLRNGKVNALSGAVLEELHRITLDLAAYLTKVELGTLGQRDDVA